MNLANRFAIGVLADEPDPRIAARGLIATAMGALGRPAVDTRYHHVGHPRPGTAMERVLKSIKGAVGGIAARDIAEGTDLEEHLVFGYLSTLKRRGLVEPMSGTTPRRYRVPA